MAGQSGGHWIHCENLGKLIQKVRRVWSRIAILSVLDKLDTMRSLVIENMQDAQRTQKAWYDHNACQRQLSIGD